MIFSAVQSTVCLQLLLDANTSAASAFLCSLWRAELPAWHPVCLGWRWTLNWSKDSSLASLASFPPVRLTRQTSALENEGKLNIFFKKLLLTADLNLKSSLIRCWSCILAVAGGFILGIIKFELELFCSWGKKSKNHYIWLLAGVWWFYRLWIMITADISYKQFLKLSAFCQKSVQSKWN